MAGCDSVTSGTGFAGTAAGSPGFADVESNFAYISGDITSLKVFK